MTMGKTVREYSSEELMRYNPRKNLEKYQKDLRVIKRGQRAWKIAQAASKVLKNKYGATRVILFGSLVKGSRFTPWSDVDLSVSGLPPGSYYKAAGEIMDMGMAKGIRIDVLDPVDCLKTMRNRIRQEGIEL